MDAFLTATSCNISQQISGFATNGDILQHCFGIVAEFILSILLFINKIENKAVCCACCSSKGVSCARNFFSHFYTSNLFAHSLYSCLPLVVTADVQSTTLPCFALPSNHAKGYRRLPSSAALIQHPPFALTEIQPLSCSTGFIGTDGKSGIVTPKLPCTYYLYFIRARAHTPIHVI